MRKNQNGFGHLVVILVILVIAAVAGAGYFVYKNQDKDKKTTTTQVTSENAEKVATESSAKIKSLPIKIDKFDPSTGMAGDIKFTKAIFPGGMQMIFSEYGYQIEGNSAGPARKNPQPTFIAPLGTAVMSIVNGTVYDVPKLYSNDYSIHVQPEGSNLIFETEHVINVKVKKGDKVKAGDIIAEVSDYDAKNFDGLGLVEMGILNPGNPPSHVCTFDYLDDSIKTDVFAKLKTLKSDWESYRGDSTIYDETKEVVPGCLTRDPIEG